MLRRRPKIKRHTVSYLLGNDKEILLEAFKEGKKVCEIPISNLTIPDLAVVLRIQAQQGRTFEFKPRIWRAVEERPTRECDEDRYTLDNGVLARYFAKERRE